MSINQVRTFIEKPGCAWTVGGIMLIGLIVGGSTGLFSGNQQAQQMQNVEPVVGPVIARIGSGTITADEIENAGRNANPDPFSQFGALASALDDSIRLSLISELASRKGIKVTDEEIKAKTERDFDMQIQMSKFQLEQQGRLKQNATDKDFEAILAANPDMAQKGIKTIADFKKAVVEETMRRLGTPAGRTQITKSILANLINEKIRPSINPTDAEIKASYDKYTLKHLTVNAKGAGTKAPLTRAKEILAEIKGGLNFEKAVDRYSNDPPLEGKRLSENTEEVAASFMRSDAVTKSLVGLKAGAISDVVASADGARIYKVVKVVHAVPPDYDKQKEKYRKEYIETVAPAFVAEEIEKLKKENLVKWESKGFKALYDLYQLGNNTELSLKDRDAQSLAIGKEAKEALTEAAGAYPARVTRYLATQLPWSNAKTEAQKKALRPERIEALQAVLDSYSDPRLTTSLAEMLLDEGRKEEAYEQLQQASDSNKGNVDPQRDGQGVYNAINAVIMKMKKAKALTTDQIRKLQESQDEWFKGWQEAMKIEADRKVQEAKDKAAREAEQKKAEAEQKKADAEAKKKADAAKKAGGNDLTKPPATTTAGEAPKIPGVNPK